MSIEIVAAKVVLGIIDLDELIHASNCALLEKFSKSLSDLATSTHLGLDGATELLRKSFIELRLEWPSHDDAVKQLTSLWLGQVVSGQVDPGSGVRSLINEILIPAGVLDSCIIHVGDTLGLHYIIGAFYSYDDVEEGAGVVGYSGKYGFDALREIDGNIITESIRWLEVHND